MDDVMPSEFAKDLAAAVAEHVADEAERWIQNSTKERPVCNGPGCGYPMYPVGKVQLDVNTGDIHSRFLSAVYMCPQCGRKQLRGEQIPALKKEQP